MYLRISSKSISQQRTPPLSHIYSSFGEGIFRLPGRRQRSFNLESPPWIMIAGPGRSVAVAAVGIRQPDPSITEATLLLVVRRRVRLTCERLAARQRQDQLKVTFRRSIDY